MSVGWFILWWVNDNGLVNEKRISILFNFLFVFLILLWFVYEIYLPYGTLCPQATGTQFNIPRRHPELCIAELIALKFKVTVAHLLCICTMAIVYKFSCTHSVISICLYRNAPMYSQTNMNKMTNPEPPPIFDRIKMKCRYCFCFICIAVAILTTTL